MADYSTLAAPPRSVRADLSRYAPEIPLSSIVVGVDNIHHDVFLSPKFVEVTRTFLFDLIRQTIKLTHFPGFERKPMRAPESAAFRKMLSEILQTSLTNAKYAKNVEHDVLLRIALLKLSRASPICFWKRKKASAIAALTLSAAKKPTS